jgi:hypothetical protein
MIEHEVFFLLRNQRWTNTEPGRAERACMCWPPRTCTLMAAPASQRARSERLLLTHVDKWAAPLQVTLRRVGTEQNRTDFQTEALELALPTYLPTTFGTHP